MRLLRARPFAQTRIFMLNVPEACADLGTVVTNGVDLSAKTHIFAFEMFYTLTFALSGDARMFPITFSPQFDFG